MSGGIGTLVRKIEEGKATSVKNLLDDEQYIKTVETAKKEMDEDLRAKGINIEITSK